MKSQPLLAALGLALGVAIAPAFGAGTETTGTPGSPSATTTIDDNPGPAPDPKFGGVMKPGARSSKAWWAPRIVPPKQAPDILLILTDDSGFGVTSTFGGVLPRPTLGASRCASGYQSTKSGLEGSRRSPRARLGPPTSS